MKQKTENDSNYAVMLSALRVVDAVITHKTQDFSKENTCKTKK